MGLQIVWFVIIAIFWTGFFVLEGFDFGVGALHTVVGKTDLERRVAINTIGPFWDGNEVWLIVAGGATFAAFPDWYATWFSALYLALVLVLFGLIIRGVSFEFRGKIQTPRWKSTWSAALTTGSIILPVLFGIALGDLLYGLPIDSNGEFTGSFWSLLTPYGIWVGDHPPLAHSVARIDVPRAAHDGDRARPSSQAHDALRARRHRHGRRVHDLDPGPFGPRRHPWAAAGHPGHRDRRRSVGRARSPRRLGVHRDCDRDRADHRLDLRRPLSERDGLEHERGEQPHRVERRVGQLRVEGHDDRRGRDLSDRARLPALELPRVPPADREPSRPHPPPPKQSQETT